MKGRSGSGASANRPAVLDPLSAALEGSDPLSQMAMAAAASVVSPLSDPLSSSLQQQGILDITDPLSRMSISSKVCRLFIR